MRRQMLGSNGRRGTVIAASAAALCLGGVLAACGGGTTDEGYVALGAAGTDSGRTPAGAVAPSGKVALVPLDRGGKGDGGGDRSGGGGHSGDRGASPGASARADGPDGGDEATSTTSGGASPPPGPSGTHGTGGSGTGGSGSGSGTGGSGGGSSGPSAPSTPSAPGSGTPAGPAVLAVGEPVRAAADERWCEKVTVKFRNTGGSPARSGTVTFATHIIGALGVDWATVESTGPLPAPIDAGAARTETYTVCVDAWRVPLGMHVETRDVTAVLK
ncbi:hypothetical protein OHU11_21830 [Streptomyces sp. NBC_00257]|uniref:hypothetical protein n=1 Tax=unclassified Streptomyces TaxID=2593676 RepID=UPI00225396C6|nr:MULTISPECIES: hypothetical protein [unclassified Streptomyces]MCX5430305.1 hypothetical protein [Streptomyces sp. NBC_00062]